MTDVAEGGASARGGWLPKTAATVALAGGAVTAAYGWAILHVVFPNLFGERSGFGWLGAATGIGGGVLCLAGGTALWRLARGRGNVRGPLQLGVAAGAIAFLPSLGDLLRFIQLSFLIGEPWESGSWAGWYPALPALVPLLTSLMLACAIPLCPKVEVDENELPTSIGLGSRVWARGLLVLVAVGWSWWAVAPLAWDGRTELRGRFRAAPDPTDEHALPPLDLAAARWRIDYERSQPGLWYRDWFEYIEFWVVVAEELDSGATRQQRQGEKPKYRLGYPGTLDAAAGIATAGETAGDLELDNYLLQLVQDPHLMVPARDQIVYALASRRDLAPGSVPLLLAIARDPALSDDAILDYGTPLEGVLPTRRKELKRRLRKTAFNALADLGAAASSILSQLDALAEDTELGADAEYAAEMIRGDMDSSEVPDDEPDKDDNDDSGEDD